MINRNNYEEYFLLLADNELSADEAAAVKQFAAQHPDLAEELDILMSCRLGDTSMPVFPKEKLLRPALWEAESLEPVQTQMLLYLDGELPRADKQQLEQQIAASIALQAEWATLQQTKLVTEAIAHPDKESLRHNDRKVRPLLWMRWAAAAVVAGLGWLFWLQQEPQPVGPANTLAATAPATTTNTTSLPPVSMPQTKANDVQSQTLPHPATAQVAAVATASKKHQTGKQPGEMASHWAGNETSQTNTNSATENTLAETKPVVARLSSIDKNLTASNAQPVPTLQVAHLSPQKITLPILAVSQKTDFFTGNKSSLAAEENDYVTIGTAHVNKQKMRGLFRNVTRTVARSFTKSKMEPDAYVTR